VLSSKDIHDRFFGLDAAQIGGLSINTSGRQQMWALLYADGADARWFGKGVGSSSILIDHYFPQLGHPHNDFLRVLYDYGAVGLTCWVAFLVGLAVVLFGAFRRLAAAGRAGRARLPYVMTPLLALVGVAAGMFTDNLMSYVFVMAPFGILVGCALGVLPRTGRVSSASLASPRAANASAPLRPSGFRRGARERALSVAVPAGDRAVRA
jgi:O-antigen ligase